MHADDLWVYSILFLSRFAIEIIAVNMKILSYAAVPLLCIVEH